MMESLAWFAAHAGPMLWPLLGLFVIASAAILERGFFFLFGGARVMGPAPGANLASWRRQLPDRRGRRRASRTAGGRILLAAAGAASALDLDAVVRREFRRLHGKLRLLGAVVTVAPLVGILGTVLGIIQGFRLDGGGPGGLDQQTLATGVAQALVTTVLGLVLAIGALLSQHFFEARADSASGALHDYLQRLAACQKEEGKHA